MPRLHYTLSRAIPLLFVLQFIASVPLHAQTSHDSLSTGHLPDAAEEYWPASKDSSGKQNISQRLKHLPVNDGKGFISIGGTLREGYENYTNYLWGMGPRGNNGYLLHRLLLHSDIRWNNFVRFFTEIENSLEFGRAGGPRPVVDEDKLAINQAFGEFSALAFLHSRLKLRLGKQALNYGTGSLLDIRDVNVRQSFAGGKLIFEHNTIKIDVFLMEAIANNPGFFDDHIDHTQKIAGAWMTQTRKHTLFNKIDAYYLYIDRDSSFFNQGYGHESRNTIGVDTWFQKDNFGGYTEADFQWGHFKDKPILAWKIVQSFFYKFNTLKFTPVLTLDCAVSSGDQKLQDPRLRTFDPIYPRGVYYGYMDNVGSANMIVVHPHLATSFTGKLRAEAGYYKFWRESINDGIYFASGVLLLPSTTAGHHVSDMYDLTVSLTSSNDITVLLIAAYDSRGAYLQKQPLTPIDILYFLARVEVAF